MKKSAFTMIELIFVIVILGLLAAVAIPKLAATKDDASLVAEISNAKQQIKNASSEFFSQGVYSNSYPSSDCYSFTPSPDGNFTVSQINESDSLCAAVHSSSQAQGLAITYQNGGLKVKF